MCGKKQHILAATAKIRILPIIMSITNWQLLKTKNRYTLPFAFHAKVKTTQMHQSNALGAALKRTEKTLASHDSAAKITRRGVVCNAIFHHARYAKQNLIVLKQGVTSVSHVYFRHANAVHNDLAAQNIAAPTNI